MATQPSPGGKPSFFQKKELGLPIWAWALIGVGAAGALYLYMRSRSSSAAPSSVPMTGSTGTSPGGFGVGGYGGAGTQPSGLEPGAPYQPANPGGGVPVGLPVGPGVTPSSPGNPSLPFQVQSGSGWWAGGSNWSTDTPAQQQAAIAKAQAAGPITDAAGNEYEWLDPQEYQSIKNSGVQVYYEVLPGVFVPVPAGLAGLAPGTPLYMQVPSGTPSAPSGGSSSSGSPSPYQPSPWWWKMQQQAAATSSGGS